MNKLNEWILLLHFSEMHRGMKKNESGEIKFSGKERKRKVMLRVWKYCDAL